MPSLKIRCLIRPINRLFRSKLNMEKKKCSLGISESGYNLVDANLNYQYRAFGVPGLGLKRGLGEDLVIAPYASVMALMVAPEQAAENLMDLEKDGFGGRYGMYEAVDYTAARSYTRPVIRDCQIVHGSSSGNVVSFSFLSAASINPCRNGLKMKHSSKPSCCCCRKGFRMPQSFIHRLYMYLIPAYGTGSADAYYPHAVHPGTGNQLLSNGRYYAMITNSGSGYSRWKDIAVTRWREDATIDDTGIFCYIRDLDNESSWSAAFPAFTAKRQNPMKWFSHRAGPNSGDWNKILKRIPKLWFRRKMMWKCGGYISLTDPQKKNTRNYQLCRSGAYHCRSRCGASGIQQSVCSDRNLPQRDAILCTRAGRRAQANRSPGCST